MAHRPASYLRVALLGALVTATGYASVQPVAAQSLEQHVALSVELLDRSVAEWRERAAVPSAEGGDEQARAAALSAVEKKFKTERTRLYLTYGTTASDHLAFFAKHTAAVAEYLAENPEIKARIDSLNVTLRTLITSDESKGAAKTGSLQ
jgi:hypothetical protein